MSYFQMFNTIIYDEKLMKDLSQKIVAADVEDARYLYEDYYVTDGERPDSVSNKFYEVPYYHWVILVTNSLTLESWPKSERVMERYLEAKYGTAVDDVRHYEDASGKTWPLSFPERFTDQDGEEHAYHFNGDGLGVVEDGSVFLLGQPVTNRQHEVALNDAKKRVRILNPAFISDITALATNLLR